MRHTLTLAAVGAAASLTLVALPASADTEDCVSHSEVDNYVNGLTRNQVWNRFDIYGDLTRETSDGEGYLVDYVPTCWAPSTRKVVIRFDYTTGESVWLIVRDI